MKIYINLVPVMEYPTTGAPYEAYKRVSIVSVDNEPSQYQEVLEVPNMDTEERFQAYAILGHLMELGIVKMAKRYLVKGSQYENYLI